MFPIFYYLTLGLRILNYFLPGYPGLDLAACQHVGVGPLRVQRGFPCQQAHLCGVPVSLQVPTLAAPLEGDRAVHDHDGPPSAVHAGNCG